MTQEEVIEELRGCGLGYWKDPNGTRPSTERLEAYGDGKVSVVDVLPDGKMLLLDGYGKPLWEGYPEDGEQVTDLVVQFGHYAAC